MDWSYVAGYFDGEGTARCKAAPSRPEYVLTALTWANTHFETLQSIQQFIGCGRLQTRKLRDGQKKVQYELIVSRMLDILRVGEQMLPHLIEKRQKVEEIMDFVRENRKPIPETWGLLANIGVEEIKRLYWKEGLLQKEIAERLGCNKGAVATFMCRNGIHGRSRGPRPKS